MKPSNYNFFFPYEYEKEKYIAYNSLSNSMALMDENSYKKYVAFEEAGIPIDDETLIENLKKGNFLIADDLNEVDMIRHDMYASRFDNRALGLTIAVTSDCNFRCIYCYEKDVIHSCYMDEETENSIVAFVEKQANNLSVLSVVWYGGEPLLNTGTIERLSQAFIKLCAKNNVTYQADIVTNGYNLTMENLQLLKRCQVSSMQITVDGDETTHNNRRPLQNGKPTFGKIMDNLTQLRDELIPVSLRINTDRENCSGVEDVLKELKARELIPKVKPYLGMVDNGNQTYENDSCLTVMEYCRYKDSFAELMIQYGYRVRDDRHYPVRKNSCCGCDRMNSYVIGPEGAIYKCWDNIGRQSTSIGNIDHADVWNRHNLYFTYMMFDPTLDSDCSMCKYLPICVGGCPEKRRFQKSGICDETKYKFEKKLADYAYQIKCAQKSVKNP